jgi:hypothetical protein
MLEAVNSVLQTAPLARGNVEQTSNARTFSANPDKVQEAPRAPYVSPFVFVDVNFDKAVLQIRDSDTGDVITQFPSETRLRAALASQPSDSSEAPSESSAQSANVSIDNSAARAAEAPAQEAQAPAAPSAGNSATQQQIAAFKTASIASSAGNSGSVSLFA